MKTSGGSTDIQIVSGVLGTGHCFATQIGEVGPIPYTSDVELDGKNTVIVMHFPQPSKNVNFDVFCTL